MDTAATGNDPQRWEKLLSFLDEKLQLGLMGRLQRLAGYKFEDSILFLTPRTKEDEEFFVKDHVLQQLTLLAQDAVKIERVKILPAALI